MSTIVGTPTLKGEIKKARASGYTFVKAMGDICDGAITMPGGTEVHITIIPCTDNPNEISSIVIRDNIPKGMHKLQYTGTQHPFCWTHETTDHVDNEILSEFGTGLKAAAVNLGNQFDLVTKYKDDTINELVYKKLQCNWDSMVAKNTFDPDIFDIEKGYYDKEHITSNKISIKSGTSMTFCNLFHDFVPDLKTTMYQIKTYISATYYNSNRTITLNGDIIKPNIPFTLRENHPWLIYTINLEIYLSPKKEYIYILNDLNDWIKNTRKKLLTTDDKGVVNSTAIKNSEYDNYSKYDIIDTLIFKGTKIQGCYTPEEDGSTPYKGGSINISRQNRMLANSKKNGDSEKDHYISFGAQRHVTEHKYNFLHLSYNTKQIGKLLGISYTKSMSGSFPSNMCCKALCLVQKELLKIIPNNSAHRESWLSKYGIEWDNKLYYDDNLLKAYANAVIIQKYVRRYLTPYFKIIVPVSNLEPGISNRSIPFPCISSPNVVPSPTPEPAPAKTNPSPAPAPTTAPALAPAPPTASALAPALMTVSDSNLPMSNHSNPYNQSELNMAQYGDQNYLGIYGCTDYGIEIDMNGTIKGKIGHTHQRGDRRRGAGDYPKRNFQMISIDTVSVNCESQLFQALNKIPEVVFETKEQFSFPTDKLGIVKKTYNTVVQQHFRAPQ
jgi:hypothetical protein